VKRRLPDPADRHVFVVCTGECCADAGAGELLDELQHRRRSRGKDLRVGRSRCIGRCQMAPAVVENGYVLGWVSQRRLKVELMRLGLEQDRQNAADRHRESVAAR
jgi:NADH:ubiquinone oxidoreductase subunit E